MSSQQLAWLTDNAFGIVSSIAAICLSIAAIIWAMQPSPWRHPPAPQYNDCLRIILGGGGSIGDAEIMCAELKKKEMKCN